VSASAAGVRPVPRRDIVHGERAPPTASATPLGKRDDQLARHRRRGERHRAARAAAAHTDQRATTLGRTTSVNASPTVPVTIPDFGWGECGRHCAAGRATQWHDGERLSRDRCRATGGRFPRASPTWSRWSWPGRRRTARRRWPRRPITMSVSDPGIKAGDTIYEVTTAAWRRWHGHG